MSRNAKLEQGRSTAPLFDTSRYTGYIEEGYRMMWKCAERGLPPASFAADRDHS